eukprot:8184176-Prorocentrum_lima.AAC.1
MASRSVATAASKRSPRRSGRTSEDGSVRPAHRGARSGGAAPTTRRTPSATERRARRHSAA